MEIEKKFLVKSLPKNLGNYKTIEIEQVYLSLNPEKRIRKANNLYFYTEKSDGTLIREENEKEITKEEYNILKKEIIHNVIEKTRYIIPLENDVKAELDIYHKKLDGLITVEIEFNNLNESISFLCPSWFGLDITEDKRYKNKNLSKLQNLNEI